MFDDVIPVFAFIAIAAVVGWLFGIAGFFRAGRALQEVATLRGMLLQRDAGAGPVAAASAPSIEPSPVVEPPAEPIPEPLPAPPVSPPPFAAPGPEPVPSGGGDAPARPGRDLEEVLTARWGVWLGAAALLLAGVFLVRYGIEQGLLGPAVRCTVMALLGVALVLGGLALGRRPLPGPRFVDRAPAALGAGGVGLLFGAAYAATVLYALVPPPIGFVLMAAASLAGLLVSLLLGQLVAAVGILGAFVTPLLVQTDDPSMPGLFGYLLFVAAASLAVVRYAAWVWLGWATTVAAAAWVLLATLSAPMADSWAPAFFVPALAALHLVLLPGAALERRVGRWLAWVPVAALGAAGLLLALADPGTATRAGVLLLAPLTLAKAAREERLAVLPWVAGFLFLLLLAAWGLPPWGRTGEPVYAGDRVLAVLPGDWVPDVLRPFLLTTFGMSAVFAAAGLAGERRWGRPLVWASYTAAVPVLALAIGYARVRQFQPDAAWCGAALALAAGLTGAAGLAARTGAVQRAGVHAAGATAALALAFATLLTAQWLTIALVLLLPALLWIEAAAGLPPLRRVALAVAAVALARLLFNDNVLDYAVGQPPLLNGRALAYAVAAAAFAGSARMAARGAQDTLGAVLRLGCAAFVSALVALEIRQWASGGDVRVPDMAFTETALQVSALGVQASIAMWLEQRTGQRVLRWAWGVQGLVALLGGIGLLIGNPMAVDGADVGRLPVLDALLPAYLLPALLAARAAGAGPFGTWWRRVLGLYALAAAFAWITLEVRHVAHPTGMGLGEAPIEDGELWAWSGAWMAMGIGLMLAGIGGRRRDLRLAALAVMGLVTAKVFLVDMGGLTGLWRVLSFLGLGLTLIGLGRLYARFAASGEGPAADPAAAP